MIETAAAKAKDVDAEVKAASAITPESTLLRLKSEAYDLIAQKEQLLRLAEQMQQALNEKNQEIAALINQI